MISRGLYALLLGTALAAIASQLYISETPEAALPEAEAAAPATPAPTAPPPAREAVGKHQDLFASRLPPPPPVPVVVAPPPPPPEPPRAPPVPYQYLGFMAEDGAIRLFLKRGDNPYVTAVGERLDDTYQVTRFDQSGVHLVYLPLKQEQVIPLGR